MALASSLLPIDMDVALDVHIALIPEHCRSGLLAYLRYGRRPGDFLRAVLSNDLAAACRHADSLNRTLLSTYVFVLSHYAPDDAWGSPDNVEQWIARGNELRKAEAT